MKGLLLKDLIQMKNNFQSSNLFLLFFGFFVAFTNRTFMMLIVVLLSSFILAMLIISTLNFDATFHWNKTVLSLPVSLTKIILSKYILIFIFGFLGMLIALIFGFIYRVINGKIPDYFFLYIVQSLLYIGVFSFITLPVSYKFGVDSAKYFVVAFIGIPVVIVYLLTFFHINPMPFFQFIQSLSTATLFIIGTITFCLIGLISFALSKKWYYGQLK